MAKSKQIAGGKENCKECSEADDLISDVQVELGDCIAALKLCSDHSANHTLPTEFYYFLSIQSLVLRSLQATLQKIEN